MTIRACVLGCGRVGETMVRDLASDKDFAVTVLDVSDRNLQRLATRSNVRRERVDLGDADQMRRAIKDYDIALGALPSRFGFQALRVCVEAGIHYCDISFMPENALEWDALAKKNGVTAVVDCGVSPGLSNLCVGHGCAHLDRADRAVIYVGGLPKARDWPFQYKAPFAPSDVIEEYTRPARMVVNGRIVEKPALTDIETIAFERVGELEAFNTDGLRSLLETVKIPEMREKTLRYPGHAELMRIFRETGLFDKNRISVGDTSVTPLEVTSALLFRKWALADEEEEFTIMRVLVEGEKDGRPVRHRYDLYDEYDPATKTRSMARTTAFPCTIMARLVAGGALRRAGVIPLERIASEDGMFDRIIGELRERGVSLTHDASPVA